MFKGNGIILRAIPYSDSARILHCFTEEQGVLAIFTRLGKKRITGHLQNGSFIQFTAKEKSGSDLLTLIDSRWDPRIPTDRLDGEAAALWMFTLELMERSLKERLSLPELFHRAATYYGYLSQGGISKAPLLPLVMLSHQLGLSDLNMVFRMAGTDVQEGLHLLGVGRDHGIDDHPAQDREAFNIEIQRFQQHIGVDHLGSVDLLDV